MPVRATVNQSVQVGVESVSGTSVPANKLLEAYIWTFGSKPTTKQFTATGRKYPAASELLMEMSQGKIAGNGCFNSLVYPLSSLFGGATITLHAGGATQANDWKWTPGLSGAYSPKTLTVQQGDAIDAEQYSYLMFPAFGYTFTRKQELEDSGDWFSQTFTDGISLTASPTPIPVVPATGAQSNVYLDTTSAGLGGTLITQDVLKVDFKASNYYGQYWPVNRANASYTSHLDLLPKNELKITLHASPAAIAYIATYLRTGVRAYIRTDVLGGAAEVDQIVGVGAASAGTFTLTYKGQTTAGIAYNALASVVQTAVQGLSTVGSGNAIVTGTAPNWTVRMAGSLATDTTVMTGSGAGLTGGAFTINTVVTNYERKHDMACFMVDVAEFGDVDGAYAYETTWMIAEDVNWGSGTAQIFTATNLLSAL